MVALLFGYQAVVQSRAQKETIAELEYELQQKTVSGQPEEADGADSPYADGTYTGEAQGYGGTVAVELTVENGKITDLTITSAEKEDTAYLDAASAVIDSILEQQSTDVDTVSDATFSSNGILHAAEDALRKAEKNHA